jgi:DNA-binding CsgD family transcriptional regulator
MAPPTLPQTDFYNETVSNSLRPHTPWRSISACRGSQLRPRRNIKDGLRRHQEGAQGAGSTSIAARADPECLPIRESHALWLLLFRNLWRRGRALPAPALFRASLIPGARFVPVDSRNHVLLESEPAWRQVIDAMDDFLPAPSAKPTGEPVPPLDELTAREHQVLELVAQGLDNDTIAGRLGISAKTIRNQVSIIFSKLGVNSRAQAIVRARDAGFGRKSFT